MKTRHKMRWLVGVLATMLVSGLLVSACGDSDTGGSGGESGGITEVKNGTQAWIGYGPMFIAESQNLGEPYGVAVKPVMFSTDQDQESGFASGKFPTSNHALNNYLRMAELGIDFTIVQMEDMSNEADAIVSCDPSITSINDLRGATVAYEEFATSDVLFRYALKQAGIDFDEIKYSPIPATDAGTAAVAGRVQVAVTYEPYLQAALKEGKDCKIIYTAGERPGLISDALAVTNDFLGSNEDAVTGTVAAWGDAVDFYDQNTKEAQGIIAKAVGEKPAGLGPSFKAIEFFDLDRSQKFFEEDFETLWNELGQIMVDQGQIKEIPDYKKYLNTDITQQAIDMRAKSGE